MFTVCLVQQFSFLRLQDCIIRSGLNQTLTGLVGHIHALHPHSSLQLLGCPMVPEQYYVMVLSLSTDDARLLCSNTGNILSPLAQLCCLCSCSHFSCHLLTMLHCHSSGWWSKLPCHGLSLERGAPLLIDARSF